jgi:hypothetical protein
MSHYHCSRCDKAFHETAVVKPNDGKALGALVGLAIGASTKNPWAALGFAVLGAMAGQVVDEEVAPQCPECAALLNLVARQYISGGLPV